MKQAMIDIETLGSGYDAVVLSLGGVKFDPFGDLEPIEPIMIKLDVEAQVDKGRKISEDTLAWWGRQSPEAKKEAFSVHDRVPVGDAMAQLNKWVVDCSRVWFQGPSFDAPILGSLMDNFGQKPNWNFWDERDARTITKLMKNDWKYKKSIDFDAHTVVGDCVAQAKCVQEAFRQCNLTYMG